MVFLPLILIAIGLIYFIRFDVMAWSVSGNIDNWQLVNSYTQTAIFGLWLMLIGGLWLMFRKR